MFITREQLLRKELAMINQMTLWLIIWLLPVILMILFSKLADRDINEISEVFLTSTRSFIEIKILCASVIILLFMFVSGPLMLWATWRRKTIIIAYGIASRQQHKLR